MRICGRSLTTGWLDPWTVKLEVTLPFEQVSRAGLALSSCFVRKRALQLVSNQRCKSKQLSKPLLISLTAREFSTCSKNDLQVIPRLGKYTLWGMQPAILAFVVWGGILNVQNYHSSSLYELHSFLMFLFMKINSSIYHLPRIGTKEDGLPSLSYPT